MSWDPSTRISGRTVNMQSSKINCKNKKETIQRGKSQCVFIQLVKLSRRVKRRKYKFVTCFLIGLSDHWCFYSYRKKLDKYTTFRNTCILMRISTYVFVVIANSNHTMRYFYMRGFYGIGEDRLRVVYMTVGETLTYAKCLLVRIS